MLRPGRSATCTNPLCVDIMACCNTQNCVAPTATNFETVAGLVANAPACVAEWCADPAKRVGGFQSDACWATPDGPDAVAGTTTLLAAQSALDDAWEHLWNLDPLHQYSGQCCTLIRPCLPCGGCGGCPACFRSQCLSLDIPSGQNIAWVDVIEAHMTVTDLNDVTAVDPVHIPGVFENPAADWALTLWPNPQLCAQVAEPSVLLPLWPDSNGQGSQPIGTPGTWGLILTFNPVVPRWYWKAVADLACVFLNECLPSGRCDEQRLPTNVTSRSNDGEVINFEVVDLDDLIDGKTGIRSVDEALIRLASRGERRSYMVDPTGAEFGEYRVEPYTCPAP